MDTMEKQGEVYSVGPVSSSSATLTRVDGAVRISDSAWLEFANETVRNASLTGTPPAVLRARWVAGDAAVVIDDGGIVSYSSVLPLYTSETRGIVSGRYPARQLTPVSVVAFATAWTAPRWRGFGFSTRLHEELQLAYRDRGDLVVGLCHGLGASRVMQRMKFELMNYQDAGFVGALSAWYESGHWHSRRGGPPSRKFYLPPCTGIEPSAIGSHRWQECVHYWVSDASVAYCLNAEFRELTGDDLSVWRHLLGVAAEEAAVAPGPGVERHVSGLTYISQT
jgi:GNAT superfamily N-acetyltransferase